VIDRFEALSQTSFRSTALLDLARAVYERGDPDEAERLAAEGEALGASEDVVNFAFGQRLRARIASDRGDSTRAEALAREALAYAYRTDFPGLHADAHAALAHVLAAAGRPGEARAEYRRALDLWQRYGYTANSSRLQALLASA